MTERKSSEKMATAARPTQAPAKGLGNEQCGTRIFGPSQKYSFRGVDSLTTLKPRKAGHDTQDESQKRNLGEELEDRKQSDFSSNKSYDDRDHRKGSQLLLKGSKRDNIEDRVVPRSVDAEDTDEDVKSDNESHDEYADDGDEVYEDDGDEVYEDDGDEEDADEEDADEDDADDGDEEHADDGDEVHTDDGDEEDVDDGDEGDADDGDKEVHAAAIAETQENSSSPSAPVCIDPSFPFVDWLESGDEALMQRECIRYGNSMADYIIRNTPRLASQPVEKTLSDAIGSLHESYYMIAYAVNKMMTEKANLTSRLEILSIEHVSTKDALKKALTRADRLAKDFRRSEEARLQADEGRQRAEEARWKAEEALQQFQRDHIANEKTWKMAEDSRKRSFEEMKVKLRSTKEELAKSHGSMTSLLDDVAKLDRVFAKNPRA